MAALIVLSKFTTLPDSTESGERGVHQRAEAITGSSTCHELQRQEALCSKVYLLHDSSGSMAEMQHPGGCTGALPQFEQVRYSKNTRVEDASRGICGLDPGEARASEAGSASATQGGQTGRSDHGVQKPACRRWLCESRVEHIALPLPELRRQVGIRWPQQDLRVNLDMGT